MVVLLTAINAIRNCLYCKVQGASSYIIPTIMEEIPAYHKTSLGAVEASCISRRTELPYLYMGAVLHYV